MTDSDHLIRRHYGAALGHLAGLNTARLTHQELAAVHLLRSAQAAAGSDEHDDDQERD